MPIVRLRCAGERVWVYNVCESMDGRVKVLRRFGAEFFQDPERRVYVTRAYEGRMRKEREGLEWLYG